MGDDQSRRRLGRGLAALIGDMDAPEPRAPASVDGRVPIERVRANPANPRRVFRDEEIDDLARSIREHGIVQPILVRPSGTDGMYEIIAGERRWRAAQKAGLAEIPILIREVDDRTALEIAIVENVQRSDLNPAEEATGYQQLIDDHHYTQEDLARVIGKSRSHVANTLRLLKLPLPVLALLREGALSAGHARTLIGAADPESLARRIIDGALSVRQAEELARRKPDKVSKQSRRPEKDADTLALERSLSDALGMAATISSGKRGGEVRIVFKTFDQLDDICRKLGGVR